jgi:hypothetical protein
VKKSQKMKTENRKGDEGGQEEGNEMEENGNGLN